MTTVDSGQRWQVGAAKTVGAAHVRGGKGCQDAFCFRDLGGAAAIAVADGHGSPRSPRSAEGAQIAAEVAVKWLEDLWHSLTPDSGAPNLSAIKQTAENVFSRGVVREWRARIAERPDAPRDVEEFGSTLLAVLATEHYLLCTQLGDGDILLVNQNGSVERPMPPDERLFANETTSLCMSDAWRDMRTEVRHIFDDPPALIVVATDGYSNSFVDDEAFLKVGPDYLALIREQGLPGVVATLEASLAEVSRRGSGDDISVGLLFLAMTPAAPASADEKGEQRGAASG